MYDASEFDIRETWGTCPACRVELDETEPAREQGLCVDCSGVGTYFPKLALVPALRETEIRKAA